LNNHRIPTEIEAGTAVVGLEPSCVAVFRDELVNLFPHDEDAKRLSQQTFLLSEFLAKHVSQEKLPKLRRKAIVQGHCHHKAVMGMSDEEQMLQKLGLVPKRRSCARLCALPSTL
jgi:Fe-S oxidoreductase